MLILDSSAGSHTSSPPKLASLDLAIEFHALESRTASAELLVEKMSNELVKVRSQIRSNLIYDSLVVVREKSTSHLLIEPKLMLSVQDLAEGTILVRFGSEKRLFDVAETHEFKHDKCSCFLVLLESSIEKAVFRFGCKELETGT